MWAGISALLTLVVMCLKLWVDQQTAIKQAKEDEDKKIDSASNATDLLREFDRLHGK